MSGVELGYRPVYMRLLLTAETAFWTTITLEEEQIDGTFDEVPWPDNTVAAIVFDKGQVWQATITGADATFLVDAAGVAAIKTSKAKTATLLVTEAGVPIPWYKGDVVWT